MADLYTDVAQKNHIGLAGHRFLDLVRARHRAEQAYFHYRTQKLLLSDRGGRSLRVLSERLDTHPRLAIHAALTSRRTLADLGAAPSWQTPLGAIFAVSQRLDLPAGDLGVVMQIRMRQVAQPASTDQKTLGERVAALEAAAERQLGMALPAGMKLERDRLSFARPMVLALLQGKGAGGDLPLPSGQTVPASRLFGYFKKTDAARLILQSLAAEVRQEVEQDLSGAKYLADFPQFLTLSGAMLELDAETKRQLFARAPSEQHFRSGGREANVSSEVKGAGSVRLLADDEPVRRSSVMPRSIGQRSRNIDISKYRHIGSAQADPDRNRLSLKSLLAQPGPTLPKRARALRQRLAEPVAPPDISTYRNVEIPSLPGVGEASQASTEHPAHTEDALLVDEDHGIYGLFDGNSAEPAGEVASSRTSRLVHRILKSLPESATSATIATALETALREACGQLAKEIKRQPNQAKMATTASVLYQHGKGATLAHVGDSRIWILKPNQALTQLTKDTANQISAAGEAARKKLKPQLLTIHVTKGDQFLLTSDGIHAVLDKPAIEQILRSVPSADQTAERLVEQAAKHRGATPADCAAIVIRI